MSHSAEKFPWGGESFSVSLISGAEKVWIRGGGGGGFSVEKFLSQFLSRFSVGNFLSHSAENFLRGGGGEPSSVSLISGAEKNWIRGGGGGGRVGISRL